MFYGVSNKYYDCYRCVEKAWEKANNTSSWSGKIEPSPAYTKATKEWLNFVMAEYLFLKFSSTRGWDLSEERLKQYAIKRVFRKGELWDIKPEEKAYLESQGLKDEYIYKYMYKFIQENYPGAYEYVRDVFAVKLTEKEKELFEVAKFAATKIEFETIKTRMSEPNQIETQREIDRCEKDLHLEDYLDPEELKWFAKITDAARMGRWAKYLKTTVFTDAAHMLLTALLANLLTLEFQEMGRIPQDISSTKVFFIGLYHDIIEVWTGDAPSPCKNEILFEHLKQNLRAVFEEFEKYAYKKYFYKYMDPRLEVEFERKVVFEEGDDVISQLVKNGDYFSADYEAYLTIKVGVLDTPYYEIIKKSYAKAMNNAASGYQNLRERTPGATKILEGMYWFVKDVRLPII